MIDVHGSLYTATLNLNFYTLVQFLCYLMPEMWDLSALRYLSAARYVYALLAQGFGGLYVICECYLFAANFSQTQAEGKVKTSSHTWINSP